MYHRSACCCFSGYRPEKFSFVCNDASLAALQQEIEAAVRKAVREGYRLFVTGMSRGFDLWAAETVLKLRGELPVQLMCALPFDAQPDQWGAQWRETHKRVLLQADLVHSLASGYTPDCFYVRNRFMVEGCARLICYHDGAPGGTQFTLQCARRSGLEIVNLADKQLCLF